MVQQKLVFSEKTNNDGGINQEKPQLRFPEFNEPWKRSKLEDICNIQDGTHSTPNYIDDGIPFFSIETITSNAEPKFISEEEHKKLIKRCKPKKGDILLTRIGTLAKSKIVDWDYDFSIYVSLALLNSIKIDSEFLNQYLNTPNYQKDFLSKSLLLAVPQKINLKDLKETKINYPSSEEQKKISLFLKNIDKKIELLEKKRDKLILEKDYYLNNIMLKQHHMDIDYDKWQTFFLGEITFVPKKKKLEKIEDEKLLTVKLHTKGVCINDNTIPKLTKRGRPYYKRYSDELLIGRQNFHNGGMGIVPIDLNGGICSNAISSFCAYEDKVTLKFLYYYLSRKNYYKNAEKFIGGTGQKEFSEKQLMKLKIEVPSLNEQVKITNFLDKLIQKIELVDEEVTLYKKYRKGLLQKMFI